MADRPTTSTSRVGKPRTRSRSVHIPTHIPIAHKARKLRTTSAQRTQTKGKGKKTIKKPNKAVTVVSSDSEDLEVDFLHYHLNKPHEVPVNLPQEYNPLADAPAEEQQELDHPVGAPIEEPHHLTHAPAEDLKVHRIQVFPIQYQYSHPHRWQTIN